MTPERWQQVKEIFDSALQLAPAERARFVAGACGADEGLRKEVESILASHEKDGSFIDSPAYEAAAGMLANEHDLKPGQKLAHYEVLSTLGKGGMGEVYLAHDTRLDRKVALKFLPSDFTSEEDRLRRFEQEARASSALNHPNILTIHEIGEADGRRFITTEFVDGETLRPRISSGPMPLGEALSIAEQAASALAAAHAVRIIHRDIKPENIMLRLDGIVKVVDFGLAKLMEEKQTGLENATHAMVTSPGVVMGTVTYMSPEQARGLPVDARTDIWSLGVVLYEMVSGGPPFAGETTSDVISLILQKEPPALTTIAVDIPERLDEIVTKALTKDREERYQTIKDLALDLKRLKQKLEMETEIERTQAPELRAVRVRPTSERAPGGRATASSIEYLASRFKLNKTGVVLAIVSLVILAVGVAYYFSQQNAQPIDSIAVLPFVNASGDPNTDYLSDGLTESIINSLSQLPQLKVMARSTVFHFKERDTDARAVGKELGVRAVMTGRLSQQGDNLIVSAELVNVLDGTQLWGEQYNRRKSDLAVLQQDISREITDRLRLKLSGEQQRQLNRGGTNNTEAYQLYLRGRSFARKGTGADLRKAIEQFQQATERDSNYALAYVGLADAYLDIGAYIGTPTREILPQARAAVERAVQIDDSLSEAHSALAHLYLVSLLWDQSEKEYRRAISLNPKVGRAEFANLLRCQMRNDEALQEIKREQEIDPLHPRAGAIAAFTYRNLGDADASIRESKRVIALDPNYPVAYVSLGLVYLGQRRYEEAIAELQKAVDLSGRGSYAVSTLGAAYAASGRLAAARAILKELEEKYARREANGTDMAILYSGLGDYDQAIAWLEKDLEAGNTVFLVYVTNTYIHERLSNDARYKDFLRRMGLRVQ